MIKYLWILLLLTSCQATQEKPSSEEARIESARYESLFGSCEAKYEGTQISQKQFENMARILRTEAGLKIFPLMVWNSPKTITDTIISANKSHVEKGKKLIEDYKKLDLPLPIKRFQRLIIEDMLFDQWRNETLLNYIESRDPEVLKSSYEGKGFYKKCDSVLKKIESLDKFSFSDEATYYLIFHEWSNCLNSQWTRFNSYNEVWTDNIISEVCEFSAELAETKLN